MVLTIAGCYVRQSRMTGLLRAGQVTKIQESMAGISFQQAMSIRNAVAGSNSLVNIYACHSVHS